MRSPKLTYKAFFLIAFSIASAQANEQMLSKVEGPAPCPNQASKAELENWVDELRKANLADLKEQEQHPMFRGLYTRSKYSIYSDRDWRLRRITVIEGRTLQDNENGPYDTVYQGEHTLLSYWKCVYRPKN